MVPIGPALPNQGQEDQWARHARLMLVLFKPWRCIDDLRLENDTWIEAFKWWLHNLDNSAAARCIIDNMQVLLECKDAHDAHFAKGHHCSSGFSAVLPQETVNQSSANDQIMDIDDLNMTQEIVDHLLDMEDRRSASDGVSAGSATECLQHMHLLGRFDLPMELELCTVGRSNGLEEIPQGDNELETVWKEAYELRWNHWRKSLQKTAGCSNKVFPA